MQLDSRIFVAGSNGLVGSAIVRKLNADGYRNILTRSRAQLNLASQIDVERFFATEQPEYVFLAAAKVGGILANSRFPADFIRENLVIQTNVIEAAWKFEIRKLQFLGSSCIYPKYSPQPIREEYLLTGELEPTNEWYAIAKIAGIKSCQAYWRQFGFKAISLMPTNLYGPGDNFDLRDSHVLPALLRRFHDGKLSGQHEISIWGSGKARREFMHVDDMASAAVFLMQNYESPEIINVGTGEDITIAELAHLVAEVVGYTGNIIFDTSKPEGTPRKLLDVSRLQGLGWQHEIMLEDGLRSTYAWFQENSQRLRTAV